LYNELAPGIISGVAIGKGAVKIPWGGCECWGSKIRTGRVIGSATKLHSKEIRGRGRESSHMWIWRQKTKG